MSEVRELNEGWAFRESTDGTEEEWRPVASVPGSVHKDLQKHGLIPDPYVDTNELSSRWVPERKWSYRTAFQSPEKKTGFRTELVFKGLDTLASIKLNGDALLEADNMFVEYRIDVTDKLRYSADNELEILFHSALVRGRELVKEHEQEHRFIAHQTEQSRLPIRKAQYDFDI